MDLRRFVKMRPTMRWPRSTSTESIPHPAHAHPRKHIPFIASPVSPDAYRRHQEEEEHNKAVKNGGVITVSAQPIGHQQIYVGHEEASTIELFYDLFFVANLVYFTAVHQHTDSQSILNYLKLFTLMWFTWLSTTLFDVRFGTESILDRCFKATHFGVMAGFVFAGSIFDGYQIGDVDTHSYQHFALILMISRIISAVQYGLVMWQSWSYKSTRLPLGLTVGVNSIAALGFLIADFAFPSINGAIMWYHMLFIFLLAIFDGLLTMAIAIFFRVISFKHTHLVERVGLLSLIIMGEGIVGLTKSVACITHTSAVNSTAELGNVVSGVLLIYLIWMLYFGQIEHKRFGTIRQQIWAILHFPLHIAVLLCVEGNTSIIVWNSAVQGFRTIQSYQPANLLQPAASYASQSEMLEKLNASMWKLDAQFVTKSWAATYNFTSDLSKIADLTASGNLTFNSATYNDKASTILTKLFTAAQAFVFEAHKESMYKILNTVPSAKDPSSLQAAYEVFDIAVLSFYVGAGVMLLILATMYWFGKLHKTKYEFGEMINRTFVGFILVIAGILAVLGDKTESGFKFAASSWLIPIVCFGFLLVLTIDNILLSAAQHTEKRHTMRASTMHHGQESFEQGGDIEALVPLPPKVRM